MSELTPIAYFASWSYPALTAEDPRPYIKLQLQRRDPTGNDHWETLYHSHALIAEPRPIQQLVLAKLVLAHYTNTDVSNDLANSLLRWPGHVLTRISVADLADFFGRRDGQLGMAL